MLGDINLTSRVHSAVIMLFMNSFSEVTVALAIVKKFSSRMNKYMDKKNDKSGIRTHAP